MPLYGIDVKIAGTLYVRAKSKREAQQLANRNAHEWIDHGGEYDLTEDGAVYLSRAMTLLGFFEGEEKVERAD